MSMQPPPDPGTDLLPASEVQTTAARLASEEVIVQAPMSFAGSAKRIWRIRRAAKGETAYVVVLTALALIGITLAWVFVLAWYVLFGILLVPYRLLRRSDRKRKLQAKQHREQLDAIQSMQNRS